MEVRALRGVCLWLAMLIDDLTYTPDAYQLNRLRTAGRPTGLISTNDRCSLLYMNGCELSTFECRIHHAFGEESMAAPSTYRTVQGLQPVCMAAYAGYRLSLRARAKWRS